MNINFYINLISAALANASEANIEAIEAYEAAYPLVVDAAYNAAGPLVYEVISGVVSEA